MDIDLLAIPEIIRLIPKVVCVAPPNVLLLQQRVKVKGMV